MERVEQIYNKEKLCINKSKLEDILKQRNIIIQSYEIYGGISGLFDFGPLGCALKQNLINFWRKHFVAYENMFEVDTPILTPKCVLEASGHTAKFNDYMVKDIKNGCCYRADHLLKLFYEKQIEDETIPIEKKSIYESEIKIIDDLTPEQLSLNIKKYDIKAPDTGNDLSEPIPFNLMFQTDIGPSGDIKGFLRPETAQGIFTLFKRNLDFNGGKVPFGVTQIGNVFRNEIAPRNGLLRVREFTLAEIEYFVLPNEKNHPNFNEIENLQVYLFSRELQLSHQEPTLIKLGDAVNMGNINSKLLAYFMGRTFLFLLQVGIPSHHIRFRQHLSTEMAHYANDCWDAEIRLSNGWVECVGHADRGDYDLSSHAKCSKVDQSVHIAYDTPIEVKETTININKGIIGKKYKKEAQKIIEYINNLNEELKEELIKSIESNGIYKVNIAGFDFELEKDIFTFKVSNKKIYGKNVIPNVIEPSFGLGRIITSIIEHSFWIRNNSDRSVLSFPAAIAPIKLGIFPLLSKSEFNLKSIEIENLCKKSFISSKIDITAVSIGKKYSRADEAGIPFGITIDYQTFTDNTVTLRDRDSTKQVRIPFNNIIDIIKELTQFYPSITFNDLLKTYPIVEVKEN